MHLHTTPISTPQPIHTALTLLCALICLCACSTKQPEPPQNTEVLIQVGDSVLTRGMVTAQIPSGLSAADSLRMFDALVQTWVERNMLVALAGSQLPDLEKIEAMVRKYREQLLANEYRRLMAHDNVKGITPAQIDQYYRTHPQQFILQRPLLKGIYLKVEQHAPNTDELRRWLKRADSTDIDSLENYGLADAMEYDYFGNTWVDWQAIADHIPYRFDDPDSFVDSNTFFEWTANGSIFMLRILDHLNTGDTKPQEFAATEIRELLMDQARADYDRQILAHLYSQGIKSKTIKPGAYTPRKYR